jgi:hypothetical protein
MPLKARISLPMKRKENFSAPCRKMPLPTTDNLLLNSGMVENFLQREIKRLRLGFTFPFCFSVYEILQAKIERIWFDQLFIIYIFELVRSSSVPAVHPPMAPPLSYPCCDTPPWQQGYYNGGGCLQDERVIWIKSGFPGGLG